MLPDDYENLSQSVIASNFLSTNILSSITSKNYWNALNDYKPLMHMWYLGILAQFYLIFPIIMAGFYKLCGRKDEREEQTLKKTNIFLGCLCFISILCYLCPFSFGINPLTAEGIRFYWLQNRFFEIALGGLAGLNLHRLTCLNRFKWSSVLSFAALLAILCISLVQFDVNALGSHLPVVGLEVEHSAGLILPPTVLLFLTVALSCIVVSQDNTKNPLLAKITRCSPLAFVGKMSLSIFVWHQIIIAFYRYLYTNQINLVMVLIYLAAVFGVSCLTYYFVEQKTKSSKPLWISILSVEILTCAAAFAIYLHAGVIRSIPELDIDVQHVHRSMHSEYCDRIYQYQKPFVQNGKLNVLIIGNSFARDWGNVLLESEMRDRINISYIYTNYNLDKLSEKHAELIAQSDYVFLFSAKTSLPDFFWQNIKNADRIFGLGTKNFGQNNGNIYRRRSEPEYFTQTVEYNPEYKALNEEWKRQWGDHYIDFIEKVLTPDGRIRVFSDDHRFLSQDCEHLTQAGAQFFAQKLNVMSIFE